MNWLNSTNAKEIGTLYLIFAVFASMILTLGSLQRLSKDDKEYNFQYVKWELKVDNTQIAINTLPLVMNFAGYSLMLLTRSYIKYILNRPFDPNIIIAEKNIQQSIRNRHLVFFALVGAPAAAALFCFVFKTAISLTDMGFITYNTPTLNVPTDNTPTYNSNALFLIISNFFKKMPDWLKILIRLLLIIIVIIKLLGLSILDLIFNIYYLKLYILISSSLVIIYQLIYLYLIHKFYNNNIKISEVLPEFLINWLKEFEILKNTSKANIKEVKNMCYIQISLYLVIMLIILLI